MNAVMLDLETWGTEVGCDIRSIGAVLFNPETGHIIDQFYVATEDGESFGLTRDPSTVKWWSEQDSKAQGAFETRVALPEALLAFSEWFGRQPFFGECLPLWCKGPHFDEVILKQVYKSVGMKHPWHYRAPRDFRTIMELAEWPETSRKGVYHHALDDAITQAEAVSLAYQIIRG